MKFVCVKFLEPIPQQIHMLRDNPNYPGAGTRADDRASDVELFAEWTRKRIGRAAVLDHDEFFQLRHLGLSPARSDPAGERGFALVLK